tara:strand:+ start:146 stop:421 length:276 start_codon:yes stop_codon:yes gene_type:complete
MNPPHVSQMANNQFWITSGDWEIFQSYSTTVAIRNTNDYRVYLHADYWDMYSATTNKYLLRFLNNHSIQEVRQIVKQGGYIVVSGWWEVEE